MVNKKYKSISQFYNAWGPGLCLSFAVFLTSSVWAGTFIAGKVVGITDGDTLTLLDESKTQYKIRISGIDTPEKGQAYGHVASENLAALAFNRLAVADCPKQDRYGRWVCIVKVDGVDIGLRQISSGLAWHYKKYANEQSVANREAYANAELEAKAAGKGLWKDPTLIPPWEWRHPVRRQNLDQRWQ